MRLAGHSSVVAALTLSVAAVAHDSHQPPPGAGSGAAFAFPPAAPGSYRLPPIKPAAGGVVLDEAGRSRDLLREALHGRVTVLALIYTRCSDVCPLATANMARLQDLAAKDARVSRRMQLVTLSFDPEHDTPEVMRGFAAAWRSSDPAAPQWSFLTAPDRSALLPILAGYNQPIETKSDASSGPLNHILRAYLVDREGRIRNIYSLDFFEPRLVMNDVQTLLLEPHAP